MLEAAAGRPLREQIARMLEAVGRSGAVPVAARGRVVLDRDGRKLVTLTRSGSQWIYRWAPEVDGAAVSWIAEQVPVLLAAWRAGASLPAVPGVVEIGSAEARGAYQSTDSPRGEGLIATEPEG